MSCFRRLSQAGQAVREDQHRGEPVEAAARSHRLRHPPRQGQQETDLVHGTSLTETLATSPIFCVSTIFRKSAFKVWNWFCSCNIFLRSTVVHQTSVFKLCNLVNCNLFHLLSNKAFTDDKLLRTWFQYLINIIPKSTV